MSKRKPNQTIDLLTGNSDAVWWADIKPGQTWVRGHKVPDGYAVSVATKRANGGVSADRVYESPNRDKAIGVMEYLAAYHAVIPHDDFSYTEFMNGANDK